jgi:septal ring factor EnvC (AmiA/AmiB activator)
METGQDELRAQLDVLQEKSSSSTARISTLESKLKETTAGERERLVVLQTENKRLEKRLKDTWTALQGAHAVVEQTKTAAKDAVRKANAAATRAEKVAVKLKQELALARGNSEPLGSVDEGSEPPSISSSRAASQTKQTKYSPVKPTIRSNNGSFDVEMQRASDLLDRISRQTSREPSLKDDESARGESETSSQVGVVGDSFGYRGAMQ